MRAKPSDAKDILDLLVGASDEKEDDDDGGRRHLDVFAILTGREGSLEDSSLQELVEMGYLGVDMGVPDIFYLYYEK
jgi:hypothetical protein